MLANKSPNNSVIDGGKMWEGHGEAECFDKEERDTLMLQTKQKLQVYLS